MSRGLLAAITAGFAAAPAAALLWPLALLMGGRDVDLAAYIGVPAFAVASIAGAFACVASLVAGWPLLVLLNWRGLNRPALVAVIGAGVAVAFLAVAGDWRFAEALPLYAYFAALGAICGATASRMSSSDPRQ